MPVGLLLFYISVTVTSLGLIAYLLFFTGSMFKLFFAAVVLLFALPVYLIGRIVHWVLFKKNVSQHFAPEGIAQFDLETLLMWSTLFFLLLPGNLNYAGWVLGWDS